jgi:hypothetical protein
MELARILDLRTPAGRSLPAILSTPEPPARSGVVLLHPYGASKEQMLGLAFALGNMGILALAIDCAGHGENRTAVSSSALKEEVETALAYLRRRFDRVGCAGAGLGGRLALMSSADYIAALSPALEQTSPEHEWILAYFPQPGVRAPHLAISELLQELGPVPAHRRPCLLLCPEREIPEVAEAVKALHSRLPQSRIHYVLSDLRPDVDHESAAIRYLQRWLNHEEIKSNLEALEIAARWLAQIPGFLEQEALLTEVERGGLHLTAKAGK